MVLTQTSSWSMSQFKAALDVFFFPQTNHSQTMMQCFYRWWAPFSFFVMISNGHSDGGLSSFHSQWRFFFSWSTKLCLMKLGSSSVIMTHYITHRAFSRCAFNLATFALKHIRISDGNDNRYWMVLIWNSNGSPADNFQALEAQVRKVRIKKKLCQQLL